MKRVFFTAAFLFLLTATFAQLAGGFKAGLNLANFTGDDSDGSDPRLGYHVGIYLTFDISEKISFQPELLIGSVGAKSTESGSDPDFGDYKIEGELTLTYVSLPAMFLLKLNENFNVQAGPQLGILVAARAKYDIESDFFDTSGSDDVKEQFNAIDFGFNVGFGVNFGAVNSSLRYCIGLADIPEEASAKNSVFMLSVGYKIPTKN